VVCRIGRVPLRFIATALILCGFGCPSVRAQQAGVLLGYGEQTSDSGYQYKTMWIVFSQEDAHVAATVQDVIVPRSTGFWRVGKTILCEYDASTEQNSSRDVLWQTAIEKAPLIEQGPACKSHKPGDLRENEDDGPSDATHQHVNLCGREAGELHFVSPGYIAEEFNAWDGCDPRGGRDTLRDNVRPIEKGEPVSLEEFFGERAAGAYSLAAKKGFAENSKEYNCPAPDPKRYDLKSWKIGHLRGSWLAVASLNEFTGGCAFWYPTDLVLPKSVTGEVPKMGLWRSIASAVPHLSDFYLSPLGDYALVLVNPKNGEYHLYAYSAKSGVLGKRLAEIPWENSNSHPIVMAQWSTGKYVAQWTAAIQKIKDHPLQDPVVRPGPPDPSLSTR
jgi:hypothetical protein